MKKSSTLFLLPILLTIFFGALPLTLVQAQAQAQGTGASISGDEVCGRWDPNANGGKGAIIKPCDIKALGVVVKGVFAIVVSLGLPLLVIFVAFRFVMAWFALQQGNAGAYKEALKKSANATMGFLLIVALFGGLLFVVLQYFGVKSDYLQVLKNILSDAFFTHAYAQTYLPNPLGVTNLYDFILSVLRLIMRFFVYPALIAIWVWTGFSFVMAQGAPDALNKAKKYLVWAFVSTLVIFMLQAFLLAARGTVQKILPGQTGQGAQGAETTIDQTASKTGTLDGRVAPTAGAVGSVCQVNGQYGMIVAGGSCSTSSRGGGGQSSGDCAGKALGTLCTLTSGGSIMVGTCTNNEQLIFSCYVATQGDTCINGNGTYGTIDSNRNCVTGGGRPLTGKGGSCQIDMQCAGVLKCVGSVCQ